jgi:hypothetical protein
VRSPEVDGQQDHPGTCSYDSQGLCDIKAHIATLQVALDGLDNILKIGEMDKDANGAGAFNQYAVYIEEAGGMVSVTAGATSGRICVLT